VASRLGYWYQDVRGSALLLMDYAEPSNLISGSLEFYNREFWKMNIATGYDLKNWTWQDLVGGIQFRAGRSSQVQISASYDVNQKMWRFLDSQLALNLGRGISIGYWGICNLSNGQMIGQDYSFTQDSHDWVTSVIYRGAQKEIWVQASLKVFPKEPVSIGADPDRVIVPSGIRR
jgi:hypothetical protein